MGEEAHPARAFVAPAHANLWNGREGGAYVGCLQAQGLDSDRLRGRYVGRGDAGAFVSRTHDRNKGPTLVVPGVGLEPTRSCEQGILSPLRLPFRHPGRRAGVYRLIIEGTYL